MIQQMSAGIIEAFLHREFENVEWKFKPMSETIKLWLLISVIGCLSVTFSITAVYAYFHVAKVWIKLYVAILLLVMGAISLWQGLVRNSVLLSQKGVAKIMQRYRFATAANAYLTDVANQMIVHNVRFMPVTRAGRMLGIMRMQDILQYVDTEIE